MYRSVYAYVYYRITCDHKIWIHPMCQFLGSKLGKSHRREKRSLGKNHRFEKRSCSSSESSANEPHYRTITIPLMSFLNAHSLQKYISKGKHHSH